MKRALISLLFVATSVAHAYDFALVDRTRTAIVGAIEESLTGAEAVAQFIPGYGVHVSVSEANLMPYPADPEEVSEVILRLLPRMSDTINGLDEGSFISVGYTFRRGEVRELIARVRVGQPDTLEVWVDGVSQ